MFLKGWISEWGKPLLFKIYARAEQLSCCSAGIHRDVKESKNRIWQKSYRTKLSVTKPAQSNTLCHAGKVANAEPNKCQSTPVHAWKSWQWSWSCSNYSSSEQPQGNHPRLYDGAHFPDVLSRDRFNVLPIALITPTWQVKKKKCMSDLIYFLNLKLKCLE